MVTSRGKEDEEDEEGEGCWRGRRGRRKGGAGCNLSRPSPPLLRIQLEL